VETGGAMPNSAFCEVPWLLVELKADTATEEVVYGALGKHSFLHRETGLSAKF